MAASAGSSEPATVNGRLRLGLQGPLAAWERHPRQARLTAGLLHKAERGAVALPWPTGLGRHRQGPGLTMPNQAAPARLALVCETFWQGRAASQVVDLCKRHNR